MARFHILRVNCWWISVKIVCYTCCLIVSSFLSFVAQFSGPNDLVVSPPVHGWGGGDCASSSNDLADHLIPGSLASHHTGPENLRQRGIWQISPDRAWEQRRRKRAANCFRKPEKHLLHEFLFRLLFSTCIPFLSCPDSSMFRCTVNQTCQCFVWKKLIS